MFTRTKHGADKVVRGLQKAGHAAEAIHGNKSQNQRERVLAAFRDGTLRTLVATDIAARGIDVDGISHVINYDLPNIPESYVHRIGRTARAGAEGIAISFCDHEERAFLRDIERLIRMAIPATDRRTGKPPAHPAPHGTPARNAQRQRSTGISAASSQPAPPQATAAIGRIIEPTAGSRPRHAEHGEGRAKRIGKCYIPARSGEPRRNAGHRPR